MSSGDFQLLVGLGNPGSKYESTRHNIGFMALQRLAFQDSASFRLNNKLFGQLADISNGLKKRRLLMPNTYMNESGRSINAAMQWFDLDINQILIIVDDMDLPLGKLRFREEGSSGGHNGLKSIISELGRKDFCRLRIGIGPPSEAAHERKDKTVRHVLGRFTKEEHSKVEIVLDKVIKGLEIIEEFGLKKGVTFINSSEVDTKEIKI